MFIDLTHSIARLNASLQTRNELDKRQYDRDERREIRTSRTQAFLIAVICVFAGIDVVSLTHII